MATVLINITTCNDNRDYFYECITHLLNNNTQHKLIVMVSDYSVESNKILYICNGLREKTDKNIVYFFRPSCGFPNNMNFALAYSYLLNIDIVGHINDDVLVQQDFVDKMVASLEDVDFVCGVQQETDEVEISLEQLKQTSFPVAINHIEYVDMIGKWGDYSAFMGKADSIAHIGKFDEGYGPVGILVDNDYTVRILKHYMKFKRDYSIRFLHGKGITQRQYRDNFPNDIVLAKSRVLFLSKWGVDVYTGDFKDTYDAPYNKPLDGSGFSKTRFEEYDFRS